MSQRVCIVTGSYGVTLPISSGVTVWSRRHGPWRIDTVNGDNLAVLSSWVRRTGHSGIIAVSPDVALMAELAKMPCSVVCTQPNPQGVRLTSVDIDDVAIGDTGARHLLDKGYRRLAFYGVSSDWSMRRYQGFRAAVAQRRQHCETNCLPETPEQWPGWPDASDDTFARHWLKGLHLPTGVMACDDVFGRLLADLAVEMKLRVPEDIAIVGVDNTESLCESDIVTLSSVDPDLKRVGQEAARLLSQKMRDPSRSFTGTVLVPPAGVVQRRSTSAVAFDDPEIAAALKFIYENACEGISVEKVCERLVMSRRQLERRFVRLLGRSPGDELRRVRVDRARELLVSTDLALADISVRCGYEHLSSFCAAFRNVMGTTPGRYRQNNAVH